MRNLINSISSTLLCLVALFMVLPMQAQTDAGQDYTQQFVPEEQILVPVVPNHVTDPAQSTVTKSAPESWSPNILMPPSSKTMKAKKGFWSKVKEKLNPMNWFGGSLKGLFMDTPVLLMLLGGAALIIGIILFYVGAFALSWGIVLLGYILVIIGSLALTIGFWWWFFEMIR